MANVTLYDVSGNSTQCLNHCLDLMKCVSLLECKDYVENVYIYPTSTEWIFIVLYIILFKFGLIGNALVCYVIWSSHHMQTFVNIFIFNLAIADFLVIFFCLPPTMLADVTETWYMGDFMCRLVPFLQTTSVSVSVLTLTAISVERYFAICKPWRERLTTRRIQMCIAVIWISSITVSVPDLIYYRVHNTFEESVTIYLRYCRRDWSETDNMAYHMFMLLVLYSIPICLMAYTYTVISRQLWRKDIPGTAESEHRSTGKMLSLSSPETQLQSRQRAAKMLMTIVVLFAVSFLPVHVLNIIRYTSSFRQIPSDVIHLVVLVSHILCYFNSAINPFIYNFMSAKFRKEFRRSIHQLWRCRCLCRSSRDPHVIMSSARTRSSLHRLERYELNTVSTRQGWVTNSNIVKKVQNPQEKYG